MQSTIEFVNPLALKGDKEASKFTNWVNSFELDIKEGYISLNDKLR